MHEMSAAFVGGQLGTWSMAFTARILKGGDADVRVVEDAPDLTHADHLGVCARECGLAGAFLGFFFFLGASSSSSSPSSDSSTSPFSSSSSERFTLLFFIFVVVFFVFFLFGLFLFLVVRFGSVVNQP